MKCKKCGYEIPYEAEICPKCGRERPSKSSIIVFFDKHPVIGFITGFFIAVLIINIILTTLI